EAGAVLSVYDPKGAQNLQKIHPPQANFRYAASPYEAATEAHALVILTEWEEFRSLDLARVRSLMCTPIIVDGRNLFAPAAMTRKGFESHTLGRGGAPSPNPQLEIRRGSCSCARLHSGTETVCVSRRVATLRGIH